MSSNRLGVIDDEKYWSESNIKGFGFGDDFESIPDESLFFGVSREAAIKKNLQLRAEVSSLSSFTSDGSSDELQNSQQRLKDLPPFLWNDTTPIALEIERSARGISLEPSRSTLIPETDKGYGSQSPNAEVTIRQFLKGSEIISLENFRTLSQKKHLLSKAVELNDGNAILSVTLFLYRTLKHGIFRQIMVENKVAANHYIAYLETRNEINHLVDLLNMLGRTKEAMLARYKQILRKGSNLQNILRELEHFHKSECVLSNEDVAAYISQHVQLLYLWKEIKEKKDCSLSAVDCDSVLKALSFVAEEFSDESSAPISTDHLRQTFNLSCKQYSWVILNAFLQQQKWPQIESLLLTKSWLGSWKEKCSLPVEDVCEVLSSAPVSVTSRFVRLIDCSDKKLQLAKKLKCHMVVIDVFASQKDRTAILTYKAGLQENSKDAVYADSILKQAIKWKN